MEIKIGETIADLRKKKGITQEQLANLVGVSTPAVSKWETNSSCPDIALLAPIARALGTNVDTLLDYVQKLTNQQAAEFAAEVALLGQNQGSTVALQRARELLCTYPENPVLQFQLAGILTGIPTKSDEEKQSNRQLAKDLLESVLESGEALYFSSAAYLLSALCMEDEELDRAEKLLEKIPSISLDKQMMTASILERRGETTKAKLTMQTILYLAFQKVETCLGKLVSQSYAPDTEEALYLCEVHRKLAELMEYPYSMSDRLTAEVYLRAGNLQAAAESLLQLAQSLCEAKPWGEVLFSEMKMGNSEQDSMLRYLCKLTYDSLRSEKQYEALYDNKTYLQAEQILKENSSL